MTIQFEQDNRSRELYFVTQGILHSYTTDAQGNQHTVQFAPEEHCTGDLAPFMAADLTSNTQNALVETELLSMTHANFIFACNRFVKFERFFRLLIQNAYVSAQRRVNQTNIPSAEERYRDLVTEQPDLAQRVPQYLIALYLGVKPQSPVFSTQLVSCPLIWHLRQRPAIFGETDSALRTPSSKPRKTLAHGRGSS